MADEKKVTQKDADRDRQQVAKQIEAEEDRGFFGREVDPTPNENYTLQTPPDAPVPETDDKARQAAQERAADISSEIGGGGRTG
jgi:hypothetical protein